MTELSPTLVATTPEAYEEAAAPRGGAVGVVLTNMFVSVGLFALMLAFGFGFWTALLAGWLGGIVLTLKLLVLIAVISENRAGARSDRDALSLKDAEQA